MLPFFLRTGSAAFRVFILILLLGLTQIKLYSPFFSGYRVTQLTNRLVGRTGVDIGLSIGQPTKQSTRSTFNLVSTKTTQTHKLCEK